MQNLNELSKAIQEAIENCKDNGSSIIKLFGANCITIRAEWEEYDFDNTFDVVTIYIKQHDVTKFRWQDKETKTRID
jgi:hypothetical protein